MLGRQIPDEVSHIACTDQYTRVPGVVRQRVPCDSKGFWRVPGGVRQRVPSDSKGFWRVPGVPIV